MPPLWLCPMPSSRQLVCIVAGAALCSCKQHTSTSDTGESPQDQIAALRAEISSLALTVADGQMLRSEIEELRNGVQQLDYQAKSERIVTLRPNSDGYAVIRTTLGQITVDILDVSANANGTSVTLNFGNPLTCDLRDVEMWLRYGETDTLGQPVQEKAKAKHVKLSRVIRGGRFTKITVGLDDIKADKFGYISIGNLQHGGIALMQ